MSSSGEETSCARRGKLIVISGPSGAGKTSICRALLERLPDTIWSVSVTTRRSRPGEVSGHCYEFVPPEEFERRASRGDFLESAEYVGERESFGEKLREHEGVQWMLGEAAMDIEVGRLLTMRAAWRLDQGDFARQDVSMAKIHVSETLHKVVDTAIQLCGARGYSKDTPLEWMYRYARQARLVDGASEVHKMVLARIYMQQQRGFWSWQ